MVARGCKGIAFAPTPTTGMVRRRNAPLLSLSLSPSPSLFHFFSPNVFLSCNRSSVAVLDDSLDRADSEQRTGRSAVSELRKLQASYNECNNIQLSVTHRTFLV